MDEKNNAIPFHTKEETFLLHRQELHHTPCLCGSSIPILSLGWHDKKLWASSPHATEAEYKSDLGTSDDELICSEDIDILYRDGTNMKLWGSI